MGVGGQRRPGCFTPIELVRNGQEPGWALGLVWTTAGNLAATGIRSPDRPARSESLFRRRYRSPLLCIICLKT